MSCPYGKRLVCHPQCYCESCGWNPKVHNERVRKIRAERGGRGRGYAKPAPYFNTFGEEVIADA